MTRHLLEVEDLACSYRGRGGVLVEAVRGVSFTVEAGETLALVGESGAGKSTVARAVVRLHRPDGGSIRLDGTDLPSLEGAALRAMRRRVQIVFQDPFTSLDPRQPVGAAVGEGLDIHDIGTPASRQARVRQLLEEVGIPPTRAGEFPHAFSGGERQRIALARALVVEPELLVLDEPVSALDVLVRSEILRLLRRMQQARNLACLFIAHDLATVAAIAQRVAVMQAGEFVEVGPVAEVLTRPTHPYTRALRDAQPRLPV